MTTFRRILTHDRTADILVKGEERCTFLTLKIDDALQFTPLAMKPNSQAAFLSSEKVALQKAVA